MIGYPLYKYFDYVLFESKGVIKGGKVHIIDAYGTFDQSEEPSYDVFVAEECCLYKHIRESMIIDYIPHASEFIPTGDIDIGQEVIFGSFVTSSMKRGIEPTSLDIDLPVRWQIVGEKENELLLLSQWCIDWDHIGALKWQTSTLRDYINNDLKKWLFDDKELALILPTQVTTRSLKNGQWVEEETTDELYIPDIEEILSFAGVSEEEIARQMARWQSSEACLSGTWREQLKKDLLICEDDEAKTCDREPYPWWLRNFIDGQAVLVNESGQIWTDEDIYMDEIGIRLMVRVKAEYSKFTSEKMLKLLGEL